MDVNQLVTMTALAAITIFQRLTVAVSTVNCYHQQFKLMQDTEAVRVGGRQMSRFVAHCYHKQDKCHDWHQTPNDCSSGGLMTVCTATLYGN